MVTEEAGTNTELALRGRKLPASRVKRPARRRIGKPAAVWREQLSTRKPHPADAPGLARKDLAERVGVTYAQLLFRERGTSKPAVWFLVKLLKILGTTFDDLLAAGEPPPRRGFMRIFGLGCNFQPRPATSSMTGRRTNPTSSKGSFA